MKTIFENNGGAYKIQGDYLLPNLTLPDEKQYSIGVWGMRHKQYLKQHHKVIYYNLLTADKLNSYLADIDKRARLLFYETVKSLAEKENVSEKLKSEKAMLWIGNATISDVKLLQDFAEKCVRSGKKQMHLMLICHKDISNYIDNNLPKEKVDGWRGVSGRFKHTTLHNNFAQMYEIISAVIKKDPDFWKDFVSKYKPQFEDLKERYVSNGLIDGKDTEGVNSAIYGCYPLHPVSTFILPRLSEKVAQNERTLFTFLSSQEKHTLSSFLESADGEFPLLTPDYLYDYFEPLFRKEVYTSEIHKIYKLTSNILQKLDGDSIHARIIKTISLIYMVEQYEKLPPV